MKITIDVPDIEVLATDIDWDSDEVNEVGITKMIIPEFVIQKMIDDDSEFTSQAFLKFISELENETETISDYITDESGFCHDGFNIAIEKGE